ncbi:MAG TPA: ornithine carbamoyltransferase, partial [Clostridiaceae bacterium]|nr:ornithine carbamoyltransferase [Clostridiaceae bacterium]
MYKHKDFISLSDYTPNEIVELMDLADQLKKERKEGNCRPLLQGKTLAMIFAKSSTRTRISFEVGIYELGGIGFYLNSNDIQLGRGETVADTARVMSRYIDGIMIRTYSHNSVIELAKHSTVPIINGLTDLEHPCQVLCDLMTVREQKGKLAGLKMAYIGDGNNMSNSLLHGAALTGMDIAVATPQGYESDPICVSQAQKIAAATGSKIEILHDPNEAIRDADVVYTDTWISMGQEEEKKERLAVFNGFTIDRTMMELA